MIEAMQEKGGNCTLCSNFTRNVGLFVPRKNSIYDSPIPGKDREYYYYLCDECQKIDNSAVLVEDKIFNKIIKGEI